MVNLDLGLIATGLAVVVAFFKMAKSIAEFGCAVTELKQAVQLSEQDRRNIWLTSNDHKERIVVVETHINEIREDISEIKYELKGR